MNLFQWLVFVGACAIGLPLLFRLVDLDLRVHRWPVVAMHGAMALSAAWGGYRGWLHVADLGNACSVLVPVLWVAISHQSWRAGVPPYFRRHHDL